MIKINEKAYLECDTNGCQLFMKKIIHDKDTGEEKEKYVGGKYSSTVLGCLHIYVNELTLMMGAEEEQHTLQDVLDMQTKILKEFEKFKP